MHWTWEFVVFLAVHFVAKEGMGAALWSGSLPGFSIFGCYMLEHRELSWNTRDGNTILFWKVSKNCIVRGVWKWCVRSSQENSLMFTHEVQLSLNSRTAVLDIWKQSDWMLRLLCFGWLFWWEPVHTWVYLGPHSSGRGGVSLGARETPVHAQREMPFLSLSDSERLNLMLWHVLWAWTFVSLTPGLSQVLCCYSRSSIYWLNLSNRTFCFFFPQARSHGGSSTSA